jgi:hypothetical protein
LEEVAFDRKLVNNAAVASFSLEQMPSTGFSGFYLQMGF